jgi:putative oxidoreductase
MDANIWCIMRIRPNLALLALRVIVFLPLFMKHGTEKLFSFGHMAQNFLDPVGIGPVPTLVIAMIADGICSLLIIVGLGTRWAALYSFCNLFVAWAIPITLRC